MGIQLKPIEEKYLSEIIILLQLISNFYPKKTNYKSILKLFLNQKYVFGVVAIDSINNGNAEKVIGFGSLHLSRKIRGGIIGFIEEIAVLENYRGRGIGKLIMQELIDKARNENCYKLVLECREEKKFFYEKLGFICSGHSMSLIL